MTKYILILTIIVTLTSCSTMHRSMQESNTRLNLTKNDFTLSDQVSGEASTTKIIMIDFARLFKSQTGTVGGDFSIPIIGGFISDKTSSYALYELMKANPGYDVVIYPQFEVKSNSFLFFFSKTTVKATARLGKLNK